VSEGHKKTTIVLGEVAPSTEVARHAALVLIHPKGALLGRRFEIGEGGAHVGRLPEFEVVLDFDGVSRRHARIGRDASGWFVEDEGSTNGTFVNDVRVQKQALSDGDLVRVGVAIVKFLAGSEVEAAYHEAIHTLAIVDPLTGLSNRRAFTEFVDREIARSLRHASALSLVMVDIDHFKRINDEHGHLAGDAVLRELGRRLKPRIRREDMVARYGGEEFACVLTGTPRSGALVFAKAVHMLVSATPFPIEGGSLRVTLSMGVADVDGSTPTTVDELVARADARLYEAKRNGRNRIEG
jgi:diguanylate cyclase (GGDEF)-like protein